MKAKYIYDWVSVGKRITEARNKAGYTQIQVSENTDISLTHYAEIERGVCGMSLKTLTNIVEFLNVSADYILFGFEIKRSPLKDKLERLSPYQRVFLEKMIDIVIRCCEDNNNYISGKSDKIT